MFECLKINSPTSAQCSNVRRYLDTKFHGQGSLWGASNLRVRPSVASLLYAMTSQGVASASWISFELADPELGFIQALDLRANVVTGLQSHNAGSESQYSFAASM